MKSLFETLSYIIVMFVWTIVAAWGFSGYYFGKGGAGSGEAMLFGLKITLITGVLIPGVLIILMLNGIFEPERFGQLSVFYIIPFVLVWFVGVIIKLFR